MSLGDDFSNKEMMDLIEMKVQKDKEQLRWEAAVAAAAPVIVWDASADYELDLTSKQIYKLMDLGPPKEEADAI